MYRLSLALNTGDYFSTAVGNAQLRGETPESAALVQQWISFGDNDILPAACTWVFPCLGVTQFNKQVLLTSGFCASNEYFHSHFQWQVWSIASTQKR